MTNQKNCVADDQTERQLCNMSLNVATRVESGAVLLDVVQASLYLSCSERYLRRLIHERRIPFVRLGGRKIRFATADLDKWIDEQRVPVRIRRRTRG